MSTVGNRGWIGKLRKRSVNRCRRRARRHTHALGATLLAMLLANMAAQAARAHDFTPWMGRPATERRHFQGNQFARAGDPQCISPLAHPAESPHEASYYVGGGARLRARAGEERRPDEGIWGMDYAGLIITKRTNLNWWHGSRYQGGFGAYRTDGPRLIHKP